MLLSIDRVLQLLSDGKSIDKIAELANCDSSNVVEIIDKARSLLNKYEKAAVKRKLIIKKKSKEAEIEVDSIEADLQREIFAGAELAVIPVQSSLIMYVSGISKESLNRSSIGIVISDKNGNQVGKVSQAIPFVDDIEVEFSAITKALKIAEYFSTSELRIRTEMESCIKLLDDSSKVKNSRVIDLLNKIKILISDVGDIKFENISPSQNDKAIFFANKSFTHKSFEK